MTSATATRTAPRLEGSLAPALARAVEASCARIAPTWPLDRFIAVNPLHGFLERPLPEVSARLAALSGSRMLLARSQYRAAFEAGHFGTRHLAAALAERGAHGSVEELVARLVSSDAEPPRRALVTDVMDGRRDTLHGMSWCEFVAHSLSQHCAAHFDEGQARFGPDRRGGLYPSWLRAARVDQSPRLLMGFRAHRDTVRRLPEAPEVLIQQALADLGVPEVEWESYLTALLLRINGWASWCSYRRWQARLAGGDDDSLVHLLALRLAWEWLLFTGLGDPESRALWRAAIDAWPALDRAAAASQGDDWLLQRALELAHQESLIAGLARGTTAAGGGAAIQVAFCIDVRSEVFRRALEATRPDVRTLGFAGFFGLPIEYRPLGAAAARPQLPGLLAPALCATDTGADPELAGRRKARLDDARAWKGLGGEALATFSFVEVFGALRAFDLVAHGLGRTRPVEPSEQAGLRPEERARLRPRLASTRDGRALDLEARVSLAAGVLRAMSLTRDFARLVVLLGHGAETTNNPHAAGLDCGACCGQTGEVNARALAALLNDPEVRDGLRARAIRIPETTRFLAGLHHTTLDEVTLFEREELPATHRAEVEGLEAALRTAGERARAERASALGLGGLSAAALARGVHERAHDWSEVRPEWGLAGNAAFVVAPRERSRHLDLAGRVFLHEYRAEQDEGHAILELILTAPMVVAHWINFQYYASTVDPLRYGSGNKVLHNVVGGHLGVFEGNGGDLRIGLPLQSVHDGERFVHTPLRLSVFVEAPREAIDAILSRHALVRNLVENQWIHLYQLDAEGVAHARRGTRWFKA